jgi:pantoate--beta-alanine ligase
VIVARTILEARAALRSLSRPLGFVPTMGALHEGHLGLVDAAKTRCTSVAASVFVNPPQFGAGEDYEKYPRDEARDLGLFEDRGVGLVFAPRADEMYDAGFATQVHVGGALTETYEGASRPSHFDGVAVIVAKLLGVVQPDRLFLGEKDAQQLAVVRRLVRDLDLPVEVVGVPTVREPDGLAMSSRNAFLTAEQRTVAPNLYRALLAGRVAAGAPGARPSASRSRGESTPGASRRARSSTVRERPCPPLSGEATTAIFGSVLMAK